MTTRLRYIRKLVKARNSVFLCNHGNQRFLLQKRYEWVKDFILPEEQGIEFGSGACHSKFYIGNYNYLATDIRNLSWLDKSKIDAEQSGFPDAYFDYIILMNVLHHLNRPVTFFREALRILKLGGKLVIFEPYSSLFFRLVLGIVGHEHCNEKADILSDKYCLENLARNFWDGNNSTGKVLFRNDDKFRENFPQFEIVNKSYSEFFVFLNSGGVYVNTFFIPVPLWFNRFKHNTDKLLVRKMPDIFAMAIRVVLQKKM